MTQNKKAIAAIVLAVMGIPFALGVGTVVAPPDKLFSPLSIVVMVMNCLAQFFMVAYFWTDKKSWVSWGGVILLLSAFFSLGLVTSGQLTIGSVVTIILGTFGAFLAIRFPAKEQ